MTIDFEFSRGIKGFMDEQEAHTLYTTARRAAAMGPCLEIGSYCGKSAYFIGKACQACSSVLFSIDHHRGSEEQQPGEGYFDPELLDSSTNRIDTFGYFQKTLEEASLMDTVVPVVCDSKTAGKMWATPLALVFIDGGHSFEAAMADYDVWAGHIMPGGVLVIHDIFLDPEQGGQAPRMVYENALASGDFTPLSMTGTLGVLEKKGVIV